MTTLDGTALQRWRAEPHRFITELMVDPETGEPFDLLPAERVFLDHCFRTDASGRLLFPEQIYGCPKKSGKTAMAGMCVLTTALIFGGAYAEAYCIANDKEQSVGRVFQACRRIVECSPLLRAEARITADQIEFSTGAVIKAIASDHAGAAGGNPNISSFDELWGYTSERSHRLWDEMVPSPVRKISARLVTTYAGFEGESLLLEELYKRGLAQPQIGPDLHAGDGILMFWSHQPVAPWQSAQWLGQMRRSLRPNQYLRMIENRWVANESAFIEMADFDRCVDADARPVLKDHSLPVFLAVDASLKRDSTAIIACSYDADLRKVRLINHKVFQPTPNQPLNFEATIEHTVKEWCALYGVRSVHFDPWQMASVAQRLSVAGIPMREFPQSVPNLTAIGSNLYELIRSGGIVVYPDDDIRLAISRAVARETDRGFTIGKAKASHKIDLVVALAMAALAAVEQGQREPVIASDFIGTHSAPRPSVIPMGGFGSSIEDQHYLQATGGRRPSSGGERGLCW